MSNTENLSLAKIEDLSLRALMAAGTSEANACPLAVATAATEAAGVASHGQATLIVNQTRPSVVTVDAATGFAHSAIELGFEHLQRDADVRTNKEDLLAQVELARNLRELAGLVGTVRNARVFKADAKVTDDADARQPMHIVHTVPMNGTGLTPKLLPMVINPEVTHLMGQAGKDIQIVGAGAQEFRNLSIDTLRDLLITGLMN